MENEKGGLGQRASTILTFSYPRFSKFIIMRELNPENNSEIFE